MEEIKDFRYQMRYWLEASKDARMRGDEANEEHAIKMFRQNRDELLSAWSSPAEKEVLCG
ncbi:MULTISPECIES: hypothetical protein [Paenibacillus]|uniref:hypothetical protein n=1 Tax=Paenibacillus TaxID=44249 RepID=UPI00096E3858|nr:hypothetical protein [Paenibacillus odorifer]OME59460.1 hypothetical protein BSK61_05905 [Paenibacillus odorifer]